jgi:dimethylhistidine N-methyltransferase
MYVSDRGSATTLTDLSPGQLEFLEEVVASLSEDQKRLPSKYFYDARGSKLFDQICDLDEYYPTRTELAVMQKYAAEIAWQIGPQVMLVEYGSGSSVKTRVLLDHLEDPVAYVPVDISREHLHQTANELARAYPHCEILPVCADFTEPFSLPDARREPSHAAVYFPGSTIGNFDPEQAGQLLLQISKICGSGGGLVIGIDLRKETSILEAAYNDREGVTAEFNLNLLRRINRELDGDFDLDEFEHTARFNPAESRIEMHLVSLSDQTVTVADHAFEFEEGESICTEYSYKHTIEQFAELAGGAGMGLRKAWTDPQEWFAVLHLIVE